MPEEYKIKHLSYVKNRSRKFIWSMQHYEGSPRMIQFYPVNKTTLRGVSANLILLLFDMEDTPAWIHAKHNADAAFLYDTPEKRLTDI